MRRAKAACPAAWAAWAWECSPILDFRFWILDSKRRRIPASSFFFERRRHRSEPRAVATGFPFDQRSTHLSKSERLAIAASLTDRSEPRAVATGFPFDHNGGFVSRRPFDYYSPTPMLWNDTDTPLAYFITFRAYGTWLHGDKRGSVDRHNNQYGTPRIPRNDTWQRIEGELLKHPPVKLDARRRTSIKKAIRETCEKRGWFLRALNI